MAMLVGINVKDKIFKKYNHDTVVLYLDFWLWNKLETC